MVSRKSSDESISGLADIEATRPAERLKEAVEVDLGLPLLVPADIPRHPVNELRQSFLAFRHTRGIPLRNGLLEDRLSQTLCHGADRNASPGRVGPGRDESDREPTPVRWSEPGLTP